MYYYKYYFNVTVSGREFRTVVDANNPQSAFTRIRHEYPDASSITFISGGKKSHIGY